MNHTAAFIAGSIGRNLLALAAGWVLLFICIQTGEHLHLPHLGDALAVGGAALAVWIAFRLRALASMVFIAADGVLFAAEGFCHAVFTYKTVQTGPVHLAVFLASLCGVLAGVFLAPRLVALRAGS